MFRLDKHPVKEAGGDIGLYAVLKGDFGKLFGGDQFHAVGGVDDLSMFVGSVSPVDLPVQTGGFLPCGASVRWSKP